jgi:endonuclease VIII
VPEGDTLFRIAATLHAALAGGTVLALDTPLALLRSQLAERSLAGRRLDRAEARGKHVLLFFDDGRALRSHLRMTGSWHLYRPGERWQKPARLARLALEVESPRGRFLAVCFSAPEVELCEAAALERHPQLSRLGPDATADAFELDAALLRLQARPELPIGVALLSQRAVAGIGNVIKSETLFLERQDPFAPVGALSATSLRALLARAHELLVKNRDGGPRTTRKAKGSRLWVYGRSGRPCLRCGALVRMQRQGDAGRSTYLCPSCQAPARVESNPAQGNL